MTTAAPTPSLFGQCLAELLDTVLLTFSGIGCVATLKVAGTSSGLQGISIIWGVGMSMTIYLSASISGAHLSPAASIALWLFAGLERHKLSFYVIAQVAGAFYAAALVYTLYSSLLIEFEQVQDIVRGSQDSLALASVLPTYPHSALSVSQAFLVEVVITVILMVVIMAFIDDDNGLPRGPLASLLISLLIAVIDSAMGPLTGFVMNPMCDFGPKLMIYLTDWGPIIFTGGHEIPYFLVPIFTPALGACLGASGYHVLIVRHLPSAIAPAGVESEKVRVS